MKTGSEALKQSGPMCVYFINEYIYAYLYMYPHDIIQT